MHACMAPIEPAGRLVARAKSKDSISVSLFVGARRRGRSRPANGVGVNGYFRWV
jgi:hypothetical protein